jgi:hypothetical protein
MGTSLNTISTSTKGYQYGVWLGNYFKDLHNIIWMSGNDWWIGCQDPTESGNNVVSIAKGIQSTNPSALQNVALECNDANCTGSTSLDNTNFASNIGVGVNAAYAYSPTYAVVRRARSQTPVTPAVMIEANYEGEQNGGTDGCISVRNCRLQEWWTMTSGAAGQLYGCHCTTHLVNSDFPLGSNVNTTGVTQLQYVPQLLTGLAWYDLVPNTNGAGGLISSGGGTCPQTGLFSSSTCITAAETTDQTFGLIYAPGPSSDQTFTVDFSKMATGGTTTARWYDPTNGNFITVTGSPFTNSGGAVSVTAGNGSANSAGAHDWVLVLQSTIGGGGSLSSDCFSAPGSCSSATVGGGYTGYPDPVAAHDPGGIANVGVPSGTSLTASGPITVNTPNTVIDAKDFSSDQGSGGTIVSVNANNVTIQNSRFTMTGTGCGLSPCGNSFIKLNCVCTLTISHVEFTTSSTTDGQSTVEHAVREEGAGQVAIDHAYSHNNVDSVIWNGHGTATITDSYVYIHQAMPGTGNGDDDHLENTYSDDATLTATHNTFFNNFPQTANIFANTGNGSGGACSNHLDISFNLLAGGGWTIYPCGNASSAGTGTMHFENNRIARCNTSEVPGGGGTWLCSGGADQYGYYPNGGSFGYHANYYCPPTNGNTWTSNKWDNNNATIAC